MMLSFPARLLLLAPLLCAAQEPGPPRTWMDPDTGHRIVRLTDEPGSASLYFNQNGYTADGRKMVYTTPEGISVLDLATHASKSGRHGKSADHRHRPQNANRLLLEGSQCSRPTWILSSTREIAKLPPRGSVATVNADETLLAGTYIEGNGADYNQDRAGRPAESRSAAQQRPDDGRAPRRASSDGPVHYRHQDRRSEDHPPRHRLAQSPGVLAHRPHPADVLPRRPLAQSGPHLDHPHRWQPHHAKSTPAP